jgi:hypothetical protein
MAVRNCVEIGENLQKIVKRLMANDNLVNLLYYTDKDPLNQPHLTEQEKKDKIFEKLIKIVPRVGPKETANSIVAIRVVGGSKLNSNTEFRNIKIAVEVFVPLTQWIIKDTNLRPFIILGEIENSLEGKTVNGLGRIDGGDFDLNFLTEEISAYEQTFWITTYE